VADRVTSIDRAKARGNRLPPAVTDEIDAAIATKVNTPTSSSRAALGCQYRATINNQNKGFASLSIGTVVDDGGPDPISVTDEAVAALVANEYTATRQALDELFSNPAVLSDADVAALVINAGSSTHNALLALIDASGGGGGGGTSDSGVAALITAATATQAALDARYALPAELKTGAPPTITAHTDAGIGASAVCGGTRISWRTTITTGTAPVSGGCLAVATLVGYMLAPVAFVNPRDAVSAAVGAYCIDDGSSLYIYSTGELEPMTPYTFDILVIGL